MAGLPEGSPGTSLEELFVNGKAKMLLLYSKTEGFLFRELEGRKHMC